MKIEALKAQCDWIVKNRELCTHTEAQLASTLLAGIGAAQNADEITDRYGDGHRSMGRKVLRAMEDAT